MLLIIVGCCCRILSSKNIWRKNPVFVPSSVATDDRVNFKELKQQQQQLERQEQQRRQSKQQQQQQQERQRQQQQEQHVSKKFWANRSSEKTAAAGLNLMIFMFWAPSRNFLLLLLLKILAVMGRPISNKNKMMGFDGGQVVAQMVHDQT